MCHSWWLTLILGHLSFPVGVAEPVFDVFDDSSVSWSQWWLKRLEHSNNRRSYDEHKPTLEADCSFDRYNCFWTCGIKCLLTVSDSTRPVRCCVSGCGMSSVLLWCLRGSSVGQHRHDLNVTLAVGCICFFTFFWMYCIKSIYINGEPCGSFTSKCKETVREEDSVLVNLGDD